MALTHALLAMLHREAGSGYDLTKRFDSAIAHFWHASHQQIYRELSRMENEGWLSHTLLPQAGKPARKVYQVTPAGLQTLHDWLHQPMDPSPVKDTLLLKLYAGAEHPEVLRQELLRHQHLHQAKLDEYRTLEQHYFSDPKRLPLSERMLYFTLRAGISHEQHRLAWCAETLASLTSLA
jgi:DNA-binding PadR family transcriptional regulator